MAIIRKLLRSAVWCKKIRPTIRKYKIFSLAAFAAVSWSAMYRDITHQEIEARSATTVKYLRKKNDHAQATLDTCIVSKMRLQETFREAIQKVIIPRIEQQNKEE